MRMDVLHVPCKEPTLRVFARIQGAAPLPELGAGWQRTLADEEDGYAVSVRVEVPDVQ
jgi:uncharacterized protein (DUF736 family)